MTMGDRIVVMKDGLIQQVATPLELYNRPVNQFVAGFIGSPPMNFFTGQIEAKPDGLFFQEGSFAVRVADEQAGALAARTGRPVIFGLRPEDVADALYTPPGQGITARVEVVEPMGAEVYVYLNTGRHAFIARVGPQSAIEVNASLPLVLNMKKAHFFHPETGMTIV
jgi:multiple sugar transport system ATP-binding protein